MLQLRDTQSEQNSRFARSHANDDADPPKFGITGPRRREHVTTHLPGAVASSPPSSSSVTIPATVAVLVDAPSAGAPPLGEQLATARRGPWS